MSRVSIFNKEGYFLTDIRALTQRSWIRNANPVPGECTFDVSIYDAKAYEPYLQFGNYVLIRHSTLPDWIGIIQVQRFGDGYITIRAIQAEHILKKRNTPNQKIEGTAGALFVQALAFFNSQPFNEKIVFPDSIFTGGPTRQQEFGADGLTICQNISMRSGNDFYLTHAFDTNGKLYLKATYTRQRGIITGKYLREGYNVELTDGIMEMDARESANYIESRGDASTPITRKSFIAYDEASINTYGLMQATKVFTANTQQATVEHNAINLLRSIKNPLTSFDVTAINIGSTFNFIDVANVVNLELNKAGWNGGVTGTNTQVVISGMEHNDENDTCRLIVERFEDYE